MRDNSLGFADVAAHLVNAHVGSSPVHLQVKSLDAGLAVWRDLIGLPVIRRNGPVASIGAGGLAQIVLDANGFSSNASNGVRRSDVAIRVPSRKDFARVLARLHEASYRHAPVDHVLVEASYLKDRDDNGIIVVHETFDRGHVKVVDGDLQLIAADGSCRSGFDPINLYKLFAMLDYGDDLKAPLPRGTHVGEVRAAATRTNHIDFRVEPRARKLTAQIGDAGCATE